MSVALVRGVARAINARIYALINSLSANGGPRRRAPPDTNGN